MDIIKIFKEELLNIKPDISKLTLKNYLSDLRHFIKWYESTTKNTFDVNGISSDIIELYSKSMGGIIDNGFLRIGEDLSVSSMKRHLSTLRKFFLILKQTEKITDNPFSQIEINADEKPTDFWHLKSFKDFLIESRISKITIKNYSSDISGFAKWYEESILPNIEKPLTGTGGFYVINQEIVEEYKRRLAEIQSAAPRTINRKLSSIRKYLEFAHKKGFISLDEISFSSLVVQESSQANINNPKPSIDLEDLKTATDSKISFSKIPPIRLFQKLALIPYLYAEENVSNILASFISGKRFVGNLELPLKASLDIQSNNSIRAQNIAIGEILGSRNINKDFFTPSTEAFKNLPVYKKLIAYAKTSRPQWYRKYHSYGFVHYVHFALLIIFATGVGIALFQNLVIKKQPITYASNLNPPRILSFQGRLTDTNDAPITTPTTVRFAIYDDLTSTGSSLLWQEVHSEITPDIDGQFSVLLGNSNLLDPSVFSENSSLFLGISVGSTSELTPRHQIASVPYAVNSEFLHGMIPITSNGAGTTNVILALDTSGNLTIGGESDTTFSATGGEFRISGKGLVLVTNAGTDSNISLVPDGSGKVDIQKPLINTSANGSIVPGGIEINDRFGILATESAVAAFVINNNTTGGDIFTASSSGTTRFTISNDGSLNSSLYTTPGGVFFANSTGQFFQTTSGSLGECLQSAGENSPTWGNCGSTSNSYTYIYSTPFQELSGAIVPNNSTVDLLIGGQSTISAKFSVTGIANNKAIASISGNLIVMPVNGWGGNMGVGNNIPLYRLHVTDSKTGTAAAQIENIATNIGGSSDCTSDSCHTGLNIRLGSPESSTAPGSADRFINFLQGDGTIIGKIRGTNNGSLAPGVAFDTAGGDFAEYFKKADPEEDLPPGSLVCLKASGGVTICDSQNFNILGVVSDVAGFVGNSSHDKDKNYVLVGLVGQVPTFMSNENGEIRPGDALSNSLTKPGAVVKATSASKIIGRALLSYNGPFISRVNILVQPSWYDPDKNFDSTGQFTLQAQTNTDPLFAKEYTVENESGEKIKKVGVFASGIMGSLKAGFIEATNGIFTSLSVETAKITDLAVNTLSIGGNTLTIAGKSLEEFILETVRNANIFYASEKIVSPIASIDQINTNIISPIASDTIAIKGNIEIKNKTNKTVASIDTEGNATFSGTLTASSSAFISSNITNLTSTDGTFSGTLYTQNIVADNIEARSISGLDDKISSIASSIMASKGTDSVLGPTTNVNTQSLSSDFGLFSQGLTVLGPVTGTQIAAMDSLSVGTSFVMSENSINTLGQDLEIQSLRQGNISFMGGLIKFDTDGNININGNINLLGNISSTNGIFTNTLTSKALMTNFISPLPGEDLVIKLNERDSTHSGNFQIQNSKNQRILTVNSSGDIHASGSANISKINFNLVGQAEATSLTQAIATGSAGFATLRRYQKELTILNKNVTEKSLIYITPYGDTSNKIIYLLRQSPENPKEGTVGSFTVGISGQLVNKNVQFNWLIVN